MNNKPLIYLDSDLAISCLMRSLCVAGYCQHAELLLGLTVSSPDSARHARRIINELPTTSVTEKAKRGALEMLSFAASHSAKAPAIQSPIDLY